MNNKYTFGNTVHKFTFEEEIDKGNIVDVTDISKEIGFNIPVYVKKNSIDFFESNIKEILELRFRKSISLIHDLISKIFKLCVSENNQNSNSFIFVPYHFEKFPHRDIRIKISLKKGDKKEPILIIEYPSFEENLKITQEENELLFPSMRKEKNKRFLEF